MRRLRVATVAAPVTLFELLSLGSPDASTWLLGAACASTDPEAFFPEPGVSTAAAKQVCASCPVITECLEDALERREHHGVRGGLSAQERRALGKQRRAADFGAVA